MIPCSENLTLEEIFLRDQLSEVHPYKRRNCELHLLLKTLPAICHQAMPVTEFRRELLIQSSPNFLVSM